MRILQRLHAYLVKTTSHINGGLLDHIIDDLRERGQEVGGVDFWVEENLGGEEALISNINAVFLVARVSVRRSLIDSKHSPCW